MKEAKLKFGKYVGLSISEIYAKDRDYLIWIARASDFSDKEVREQIRAFLKKKKVNVAPINKKKGRVMDRKKFWNISGTLSGRDYYPDRI